MPNRKKAPDGLPKTVAFRVTNYDHNRIKHRAELYFDGNVGDYLRWLVNEKHQPRKVAKLLPKDSKPR